MVDDVHVWGGLTELLASYLDAHDIDAPAVRQTLQRYDSNQRMPITTWWTLLEQLAAIDPTPALGIRIGQHIKVHHLGVLGYLAASCDTLGEVMLRFQRFQPLLHNLNPNLIRHDGCATELSWDAAYGRSTQLSDEVLASSLLHIARHLTGQSQLTLKSVAFAGHQPSDPDLYAELLGCPVHFSANTLIIQLDDEVLSRPINSSDPHLREVLNQQAETLLQTIPSPDTFLHDLQRTLIDALPEGHCSQAAIARKLGIPSRTLYRQLESRAITYKEVLNKLRFQLAKNYLADPHLSLAEIALMLAYSEQSAFSRAFKSWCGQTPLRYRKGIIN